MAETLTATTSPERVAGSAQALLVVDDDCVCVEASLGACRMLGASRAAVVGRAVEDLLEPESRESFRHIWHAFRVAGGHAEPFALEAPATVVEVGATVTAEVLPSRHLIALDSVTEPPEHPPEPHGPRQPTARERQVLSLLAGGATDGQIAARLKVSPATVQTHVRNAKSKLGARTRAQAVALALQRGLIETR